MSDVLIKNIQIPKDNKRLALFIDKDGDVTVFEGNEFNRITDAIEVPPHGELKDTNKILQWLNRICDERQSVSVGEIIDYIENAPTVLEATE